MFLGCQLYAIRKRVIAVIVSSGLVVQVSNLTLIGDFLYALQASNYQLSREKYA